MAQKTVKVRPQPVVIRDDETQKVLFTLDYNRAVIARASDEGFDAMNIESMEDKPTSAINKLYYYSFMMHQPEMTDQEINEAIDEYIVGSGLFFNEKFVDRMLSLFGAAVLSMADGDRKNVKATVVF